MYPQFPETKTEFQLHQQKSLKSVLTTATDSSGTGVQSTATSTIYNNVILYLSLCSLSCTAGESQSEEIDAAQSTSAQATDSGTYYVAPKI